MMNNDWNNTNVVAITNSDQYFYASKVRNWVVSQIRAALIHEN